MSQQNKLSLFLSGGNAHQSNHLYTIQAIFGYDGLDLRYFEVTNAPYKNIKDNNIEAVKLDYCDQELQ